jgi:hypothetical protein
MREIVNGISVRHSGFPWRQLPSDLPSLSTVEPKRHWRGGVVLGKIV